MSGDVLVPVLVTLLIVNVILIVRAVVRHQLRRQDAAAGVAAMTGSQTEPEPEPAVAPAPAEPDPAVLQPAPAQTGRDLLTGLDDQAAWDRRVADESVRARRYRRPVTIVSIELDGLDRLEVLLGVEAADRLVRAMADTLRRLARDTDAIARVGRGGFGVLMPETSADAATRYVERVSRACELWLESAATTVRLAIGWAAGSGDVDLAEIERLAVEVRRVDGWRDAHLPAVAPVPVEVEPAATVEAAVVVEPVAAVEPPAAAALPAPGSPPPAVRAPTVATQGLDPRRSPGHKRDHRRDWHR